MDFIQTIKRLQPHYPTCSICTLPECTHPYRFFAYHGYLEYLDSTIDPAAPGRETDITLFMTNLAKVEFGFEPEDRVEVCTVCYKEECENLHRTLTREGYARFVREVQGVKSAEEAVLMADEMFGDDAGLGSLDDMEADLGGRAQRYRDALRGLNDVEATLRGLDDVEAAFASQTQRYGAGLGSLDDMEAALGGRTGDGAASGSLDDMEATFRARSRGGGSGSYGEEGFPEAADEGSEYYKEFDGRLEWDIRNETIHLKKEWEEGLPRVSNHPQDFETFRQYIKDKWIRKADGYPETNHPETHRTMPWDDMTWDQLQELALPPQPKPPQPTPLERSTTPPPRLTDAEYEKARRNFFTRWEKMTPHKSFEQRDELRLVIQASWERRVGARGIEENMPWHIDFYSKPYRPLVQPPWDPSRARRGGWVSDEDKLPFRKEWEDMAFGKDGKLRKDPMQRYALARLVQAAFVSAVGPRGEEEVMPWTPDLVCPEPEAESLNTPLPDTSLETDYTTLRSEYALIYINRIKGEDQEEVERVAGVFREAWVQEVGVGARDVRMPWDEVLGKRADEVVEKEEERDVVGGEGIGGGRLRGRPKRRVEGWRRRGGGRGCEFQ
jgi:hypothetical protein